MTTRSPTLVPTAVACLLALACRPSKAPDEPDPPAEPPSIAEVVEWLVGEQLRGTKTSPHGPSLGIVTLPLTAGSLDEGTLQPGSCAPELVSFIPMPGTKSDWLAVDKSGALLRYSGKGWAPVASKLALPPIAKLLGFAGTTNPPRELLVYKHGDNEQLWQLTFFEDVIVDQKPIGRRMFSKRAAALEQFDSRRCLERTRNCLHLTVVDEVVHLGREPELYANWEPVMDLGKTAARDVRYIDSKGKKVGVLVASKCESPPASTTPTPATPEASTSAPTPKK
jgi:hypothetical protein